MRTRRTSISADDEDEKNVYICSRRGQEERLSLQSMRSRRRPTLATVTAELLGVFWEWFWPRKWLISSNRPGYTMHPDFIKTHTEEARPTWRQRAPDPLYYQHQVRISVLTCAAGLASSISVSPKRQMSYSNPAFPILVQRVNLWQCNIYPPPTSPSPPPHPSPPPPTPPLSLSPSSPYPNNVSCSFRTCLCQRTRRHLENLCTHNDLRRG